MKIGIFDSGIGGLTVLKEMLKYHPQHHYIYFGDSKNLPYGNKSKQELMILANNIINFLIEKKVDLIIIACGTISSNIAEELKNNYQIPIIDIVNPTIKYLNDKKMRDVGIIATTMTIKSKTFDKSNLTNVKNLVLQDCPSFVPIIENNEIDTKLCDIKIEEYLSSMKKSNIKSLVLGCTHYPLLSNKISTYFNNNINIINMGTIIAENLNLAKQTTFELELYFSELNDSLINNVNNIIGNYPVKIKIIK